jgi:hypothetical protein
MKIKDNGKLSIHKNKNDHKIKILLPEIYTDRKFSKISKEKEVKNINDDDLKTSPLNFIDLQYKKVIENFVEYNNNNNNKMHDMLYNNITVKPYPKLINKPYLIHKNNFNLELSSTKSVTEMYKNKINHERKLKPIHDEKIIPINTHDRNIHLNNIENKMFNFSNNDNYDTNKLGVFWENLKKSNEYKFNINNNDDSNDSTISYTNEIYPILWGNKYTIEEVYIIFFDLFEILYI